jgi:CubicO group peptidase (beta-lactamase class C family)
MKTKCFRSMMAVPCLVLAAALGRPGHTVRALAGTSGAGQWQEYFDRTIPQQLAELHIAGAAVAVVEGGGLAFAKGYGLADAENRIAVRPDTTLFRIGSVSKLFTWTAVMQLTEQGTLDLDADVNGYLDFRIPDTFPQPVTLRHLMAHTAGFEDRLAGYSAVDAEGMAPLGEWLAAHIPARVRPAGEVSAYSNYGAALAGYIVERASGVPLEEYLERSIFEPLGMLHTTIRQPLPAAWEPDMSKGYTFAGGGFLPLDFEYIVPFPTGGATSTAADMARFVSAHLQGGEYPGGRILRAATADLMHSRLFAHDGRLNGWAYGFCEMSRNGLRVIGHGGDTRLFHSLLMIVPEKNLGLFAVYNSENAFDAQTLLLDGFLDEFFPAAAPGVKKWIMSPADLARFAGSYRQNRRFAETTVEKAANLFEPIIVEATADGALQLTSAMYGGYRFLPIGPMAFVQEDDPQNLLIFRSDAEGNIAGAFVNDDPGVMFLKLPGYADYTLHYGILLAAVCLFLAALLMACGRWIVRRIRRKPNAEVRPAVFGRRIINLLALLGFLFPIGFVLGFNGIVYDKAEFLNLVLALPVLIIVLTAAALYFVVRSWRERFWSPAERIFNMLLLGVAGLYIWSLSCWNLLGWRY